MQHEMPDCAGNVVRNRVPRSKEARAVSEVMGSYARCGVFRDLREGNMRVGRIIFRMRWHHDLVYRFVLDIEASELSFPALLPGVNARSPQFRELTTLLRSPSREELAAHRDIDPGKGEWRLFVRHGALTLGTAVKNGEYEYCTRRLVCLAQEILTSAVVAKPQRDSELKRLKAEKVYASDAPA